MGNDQIFETAEIKKLMHLEFFLNLLFFLGKLKKCLIWNMPKTFNLRNFKIFFNWHSESYKIFKIVQLEKLTNFRNFENLLIFQLGKLKKFLIWKILRISNLGNFKKKSLIDYFGKWLNFWNCSIGKFDVTALLGN